MAALIAIVLVLGACYSPDLRDCTVACASNADCAGGHVCGTQGLCAAPDVSCSVTGPDGSAPTDAPDADAMEPDARPDARPDAAPPAMIVALVIEIKGHGSVHVDGSATCGPPMCNLQFPAGTSVTLHALPDDDREFDRWEEACTGMSHTCSLVLHLPITKARAKFRD